MSNLVTAKLTPQEWDFRRKHRTQHAMNVTLLFAPCTIFLLVMFFLPIAYVMTLSVTTPKVSFDHFIRIFTVPVYLQTLWNTFKTSAIVTLVCLLLGYPVAYIMAKRNDFLALLMLSIVAMTFWTSMVVRTYAWLIILGNRGPVVTLFGAFGIELPQILFNTFSSTVGLVHILLPYMIFALYGVMSRIDPNHMRAASVLGARPFDAFRLVYFPLSLPGVITGSILVFTICLGFFVTPVLLGGPADMMISQVIYDQIDALLNWGFASALATTLLVATLIVYWIYNRFFGLDQLWK